MRTMKNRIVLAVIVLSVVLPLYASAQVTSNQVYLQYRDAVPYYSPNYSYDTPRYGTRVVEGQTFYYLLPTQSSPVYYNGAIYPTGYPYPPNQTSGYGYYSIASALSVSCAPTDTVASIGRTVTWIASVTGGTGQYSYIWGGTDNLTGYTSSVRYAYATTGDKFATVTVTSGTQIITAGCTRGVRIEPFTQSQPAVVMPRLGVSCYAAQERIAPGEAATWLSVASGISPTATTTYQWDGTDGLSGTGPAAFKTYTAQGLKHALLTVTSGGQRSVTACTNAVTVAPKTSPQPAVRTITKTVTAPAPLQGLCTPSKAKAEVGEEVLWSAVAVGGTLNGQSPSGNVGSYTYLWKGDEELTGTAATTSKQYEEEGVKTASVTITSGDKSAPVACASPVEIVPKKDTGLLAAAFFSGWFDTLSLILAALLAVAVGIILALRKKRQEQEQVLNH